MADYHTQFSVMFPVKDTAGAMDILADLRDKAEADDYDDDATFAFHAEVQGDKIWMHDDGSSDTTGLVTFVLAVAEAQGLTGHWGFEYAVTCSRPRVDGFGGGCTILDLGTGDFTSINSFDLLSNAIPDSHPIDHQPINLPTKTDTRIEVTIPLIVKATVSGWYEAGDEIPTADEITYILQAEIDHNGGFTTQVGQVYLQIEGAGSPGYYDPSKDGVGG